MKIFDKIRYVSKIKRSLISLDKLDHLRYRFLIHGGVIRVSQSALVIMKVVKLKKKNLYTLEWSTLIGILQVEEITSTIKSVKWYLRKS